MKKIGFIALLIIIVLIGLPFVTGKVAETATMQLTQQLNSSDDYGEVEVVDYDRGIRSTQSVFSWRPPVGAESEFSGTIEYTCDGSHGMVSYNYICRALDIPVYSKFVSEKLGGIDPVKLSGSVSLLGAITNSIHIDQFEIAESTGEYVNVYSGEVTIATDKDFNSFKTEGSWNGAKLKDEDADIELGSIELKGEFWKSPLDIFLGKYEVSLSELLFKSDGEDSLTVSDVESKGWFEEAGDELVLGHNWSVDYLEANQKNQSDLQGFTNASDLKFQSKVSGIKAEQFAVLYGLIKELAELESQSGQAVDAQRNQKMIALIPALEALLVEGLALDLDFSSKHDGELIEFDLDLKLNDDIGFADSILLSVQPQAFLNKLRVTLESSLPAAMIDKNPSGSHAFINNSLYEKDGDKYRLSFFVREDEVELNGSIMTAQEFLAFMAGR